MTRLSKISVLSIALSLVAACGASKNAPSGSVSGGLGNSMTILSCSLGCSSGGQGLPVSCGTGTIKANEEIAIEFTQPVSLASVSKATFRITNSSTGLAPPGVFVIDPANSRRLVFRPQISFDPNGTPKFGFEVGSSYTIRVNGTLHNSGPYLTGVTGEKNTAGMLCSVAVAPGLIDVSPGPSNVSIFADQVTSTGPNGEVLEVIEAEVTGSVELVNVWAFSPIRLTFDDIISPVTVLNPGATSSPTVRFFLDPDGIIGEQADWIPLEGAFELQLNETSLTSALTFQPSAGFPSAGQGAEPRRVVIEIISGIQDLAGAPLENPGVFSFVPETADFGEVILPAGGEQFVDQLNMDQDRSGALWESGRLVAGLGGGAGVMGELRIRLGDSPFVLDTDSMDFQNFDVLVEGSTSFPPNGTAPSVTATGGVFEFSSLEVDPGAQLVLQGSNPARIFVRGRALVSGDVVGIGKAPVDNETPVGGHSSNLGSGGVGGLGGLGAGAGGKGADRPDDSGTTLLFLPPPGQGVPNPGAVVDGESGEGVGGAASGLNLGGGEGGVHWPSTLPFGLTNFGTFQPNQLCQGDQVGNPGAGGGYGTNGGESNAVWPNPTFNDPAGSNMWPGVNSLGGDPLNIGVTPLVMELSPLLGNLRGGSGGGGGGAHIHLSRTGGPAFGNCLGAGLIFYASHSGAGGGSGGGALQIQAGTEVRVSGRIDLSGGQGGDAAEDTAPVAVKGQSAPGGGGSGGAFLAQGRQVIFSSLVSSVVIIGGEGGVGVGGSTGGTGGAGIVRVESGSSQTSVEFAQKIVPFDSNEAGVTGGADSDKILSVGAWQEDITGPGARSGAQSCWLRPSGSFFELDFLEDDFSDPVNPVLGWDMQITTPATVGTPFSFRDANDPNNPFGSSAEVLFGSELGGASAAPVVVRFQGGRLDETLTNLCDAVLESEGGGILEGSLTPWLLHPSELNDYWDTALPGDPQLAGQRRSNIIRYMVVIDRSSVNASAFNSVESFQIVVLPN